MTFGQAIHEARGRSGLQQKTVAAHCHISAAFLGDLERDRRHTYNPDILFTLSRLLRLPLSYLYYLNGRIPPNLCDLPMHPKAVVSAWNVFEAELFRGGYEDQPHAEAS